MDLTTRTSRFLAGALAALTLTTTTFIAPPAQAWNPFSWIDHADGSVINRVVHGVVGGVLTVVGAAAVITGLILFPLPLLGPPIFLAGAATGMFGFSMLKGAIQNETVAKEWSVFLHSGSIGTNTPRSGQIYKGSSGAAAFQGQGGGQTR